LTQGTNQPESNQVSITEADRRMVALASLVALATGIPWRRPDVRGRVEVPSGNLRRPSLHPPLGDLAPAQKRLLAVVLGGPQHPQKRQRGAPVMRSSRHGPQFDVFPPQPL